MADSKIVQIKLKTVADISDVQSNVKEIQKALNGITLSKGLETKFANLFANIEKNSEKASQAMTSGFKNKSDVTAYEKATNQIVADMKSLAVAMGQIDSSKLNFEVDPAQVKNLVEDIKRLKEEINQIRTDNLKKLETLKSDPPSKAQAWQDFFDAFAKGDEGIEDAEKALNRLQGQLSKAKKANKDFAEGSQWGNYQQGVETCSEALKILKGETGEVAEKQQELNIKTTQYKQIQEKTNQQGKEWLDNLITGTKQATDGTENLTKSEQNLSSQQQQLNSELDQFKSRVTYFFGMNNAVNLLQRALQSAYSTVKELDEVMTETAVVTDFSVSDMWSQLPEYTQRANELGVSIQSAYEAATLYYQQGLNTNEVMAVSNETLKMARIAGLDAATATDRMTNALRGFNMEINEANAQNINDVYSKLAAITASDVDEISTAMTKVASLADNANMSFETTAAFLSQIIETTRESAETAGTALKTVVARFSEVKELYSEGELLGTDSEGEEIDVNKVSTALRSAGIDLNEYLTGMKGLDDIFLELSEKWDSLDQVQQRYIATMAAGSRQQSRFIAMMSDYARTTELVSAANNASGASQEQFNKTLESLETKLAQLQNAWDSFLMGIADSDVIKVAVDALTQLITAINNMTSGLGKFSSIAKIVLAGTLLKIGKAAFDGLFNVIGARIKAAATQSGKTTAINWMQGFKTGIQKNGGGIGGVIKTAFTNTSGTGEWTKDIQNDFFKAINGGLTSGTINQKQAQELYIIYREQGYDACKQHADELGVSLDNLNEKSKNFQGTAKATTLNLQSIGTAAMAAGGAISMLGQLFNDGSEEGEKTAKVFSTIGTIIMGVGTAMTALGAISKVIGVSISTSMWAAGVTTSEAGTVAQIGWGWISAIMLAIVALVGAAIAGFKAIKKNSPTGQLEAAQEAAENAAQAAEDTAEAYNNLSTALDNIAEKSSAIEELAIGTQEWRDAVKEANSEVLALTEQYAELGDYVILENGHLVWTDEDAVEKIKASYEAAVSLADSAAAMATINQYQKNQNALAEQYKLDGFVGKTTTTTVTNSAYGSVSNTSENTYDDTPLKELAKLVAEGTINTEKEYQDWIEKYNSKAENYIKAIDGDITTEEQSFYTFALTFDEVKSDLKAMGKDLVSLDKQIEAQYKSIASNAITLTGIEETATEAVAEMSNYLTSERISDMIDKELAEVNTIGKYNYDDNAAYAAYFKKKYGSDFESIGSKGEVNLKTGTDLTAEQARLEFATAQATEDLSDQAEKLIELFDKFDDEIGPIRKIYDKAEGGALNQEDIYRLTGLNYEQIHDGADLNDLAQQAFSNLPDELKSMYDEDGADFVKEFIEALQLVSETYYTTTKDLDNLNISTNFSRKLSASSLDTLSDNLIKIFEASGSKAANSIIATINDFTEGMSTSEAETFAQTLGNLDWTDVSKVEGFSDTIKDLGLTTGKSEDEIDKLEQQIITLAKASKTVDFEALQKQIQTLGNLGYELSTGAQSTSFSSDQMESLIEAGAAEEADFSYNIATDTWDYIAGSTEDIVEAIQKQTGSLLESNIESAIASGEAFDKTGDSFYSENGNLDITDRYSLFQFLNEYNKQAGEDSVTTYDSILHAYILSDEDNSLELLQEIYKKAKETSTNLKKNIEDSNTFKLQSERVVAQSKNTSYQNAALISSSEDANIYGVALLNQATAAGVATEKIEEYSKALKDGDLETIKAKAATLADMTAIYQEAQAWETDTELLEKYAKALQEADKEMDESTAYAIALHDINLNTGYEKLIDSYDEWHDVLLGSDDVNKTTVEYREALMDLSDSVSQMLNTTIPLNSAFFETADVLSLVEKAAQGDTEAIDDLHEAAAKQLLTQFADEGVDDAILNQLSTSASSIDTNDLDKLNSLVSESGLTNEQITSYLSALGYAADINTTASGIPTIQSLTLTGNNVNQSLLDTAEENKAEKFENSYTELYNINEKLNEQIREKEKLERDYEKALETEGTTAENIRKIYNGQIDALKQEETIQEERIKTAKELLENLKNQYADVMEYASYKDGVIDIKWRDLDGLSTEEGERVEEYIKYLEEYSQELEEAEDALYDIQDTIEDTQQQVIDSYMSFEDRVMDAYVSAKEEEIDAIEETTDAINDANSDLISKIQDQIDSQRQARTNTESESNISNLESRIAYLRQDTSGANQLEILQLEEELEGARQDYQDDLIDQALERMQSDADVAAEQRATQISIMREQLELQKKDGSLWNMVHELIEGAQNSDGSLNMDSALVTLLKGQESFQSLSELGQQEWIRALVSAYNRSRAYTEYASGGLVDFTGPAWLDGTKSNPEMVLSSVDTQNFMALRDTLSKLLNNGDLDGGGGDAYYDININAEIGSDYDVDQLADKIKKQITDSSAYRNVNTMNFIR